LVGWHHQSLLGRGSRHCYGINYTHNQDLPDRNFARTWQVLCDAIRGGSSAAVMQEEKRLPLGIAGDLLVNTVQFVTRCGLIPPRRFLR